MITNTAPSFNLPRTGTASLDMGSAQSLALQNDGKLVLGGIRGSVGSGYDFSVVRLNADGSLDTSFSGDGQTLIVGGHYDLARSVVVQPDGKLVLGGSSDINGGNDVSVVRLNADGSLDTGFSGDGKTVIDVGGTGNDDFAFIDPAR